MTQEEIEAKAKKLAINATLSIDDNGKEVYNALVEAALQEMAEWLLDNMWISVEDELPPFDEEVIVYAICDIGQIQFFCHRSNNPYVFTDKYGFCVYSSNDKITHWMPIPRKNEK